MLFESPFRQLKSDKEFSPDVADKEKREENEGSNYCNASTTAAVV